MGLNEEGRRRLTPAQALMEYFNLPSGEFRTAYLSLSKEERDEMSKEAAKALDVELM
jgi:hypothetical protein